LGRDRGLALRRATKPVGAWGKSRRALLSLLRAMQRDVDLIAYGPIQSATSRSEIRHVLAAPLWRARPLAGSLHRRDRLQS